MDASGRGLRVPAAARPPSGSQNPRLGLQVPLLVPLLDRGHKPGGTNTWLKISSGRLTRTARWVPQIVKPARLVHPHWLATRR
jgi:hypothetical protein